MDNTEEQQKIEDARIGYETAVALYVYEGQTIWAMFNAMLVVNSIVVAAQGLFTQGPIVIALPLLGIVLCVAWYVLMDRSFWIHDYRIKSARELEELYLSSVIKTLSRGADFHAGHPVTLILGNKEDKTRLPLLDRKVPTRLLVRMVIAAFGVLHVLLLLA